MHENQMMPERADADSEDHVAQCGTGIMVRMDGETDEEWLRRIDQRRSPKRFKVVEHSAFGPFPCR